MNILGKRSDLPFSRNSDHKKEKSTVSFKHVHSITCSQTQLDGITHEQTIICRQLFAGHVMGSWPMKRKKNLRRMIINLARNFPRPCSARKKYYATGKISARISNGNRTEWSPIRSGIIRVINKIGRPRSGSPICLITSMITDRIGRHEVL